MLLCSCLIDNGRLEGPCSTLDGLQAPAYKELHITLDAVRQEALSDLRWQSPKCRKKPRVFGGLPVRWRKEGANDGDYCSIPV